MKNWYTYIVKCNDNSLYTGITVDLNKRIDKHNSGKGAKYTKTRLPVKLVYSEKYKNKSEASKEEYRIKQLKKIDKLKLIKTNETRNNNEI